MYSHSTVDIVCTESRVQYSVVHYSTVIVHSRVQYVQS